MTVLVHQSSRAFKSLHNRQLQGHLRSLTMLHGLLFDRVVIHGRSTKGLTYTFVHGSHTPQVRAVRAWGHGDFTTSTKIRLRNPADQYFVMFQIQASFLLFFYSFFSYAWHFFYFLLRFSLWIQLKALFFQAMVSKLILIRLVTKFKINQVSVNFLLTFSIKKACFRWRTVGAKFEF